MQVKTGQAFPSVDRRFGSARIDKNFGIICSSSRASHTSNNSPPEDSPDLAYASGLAFSPIPPSLTRSTLNPVEAAVS